MAAPYICIHLHIHRSFCILHCQHLEMVMIELIESVAARRFIFCLNFWMCFQWVFLNLPPLKFSMDTKNIPC